MKTTILKWALFIGVIVAGVVLGELGVRADDTAPVQPDASGVSAVVKLLPAGMDNTAGFFCSAFFVGKDTVVSAGHCAADAHGADLKVVLQDGETDTAVIAEYGDPAGGAHDYSILRLTGPSPLNWKPVDLDCSGLIPKIGTDVRDEGFPGSEEGFTTSWGKVNTGPRVITGAWSLPVIGVQVPNDGGNSGGPSFYGDTNTAWGIVVGKNPSQPGFGMVQPIGPVCYALELSGPALHLN